MTHQPSPRPPGPPRKDGFIGWHERGYLPHRDQTGLTQFVTFRLADSFPQHLRAEWGPVMGIEDSRIRRIRINDYLDNGRGSCVLGMPAVASLVEGNFQQFAGPRYELRAWVIMPNHVHVLIKVGNAPLHEIVGAWKRHTARLANRLLGASGPFWAPDYFDVFMRDGEHERRTTRYIENNPAKARLVLDPKHWSWSSARLRDGYGRLTV